MTDFSQQDLIEFAEAEKAALLSADFAALTELLSKKEDLAEAMAEGRVKLSQKDLPKIKESFLDNNRLYEASIFGVRAAKERLAEVKRVSEGTDTYQPDGTRRKTPYVSKDLEKRA